jgi:putative hydrolase of the HAD superfamily
LIELQHIVFDLDDTLFLERDFVASGFRAVARRFEEMFGAQGFAEMCWYEFESGNRGRIFEHAAKGLGVELSAAQLCVLVDCYRRHHPSIDLAHGGERLLSVLGRTYPLSLLTGGYPLTQRRKLEALKIQDRFHCVVFAGRNGPHFDKPHLSSWLELESSLRVPSERILYVADNPKKDWPSSKARGWHFLRLRNEKALYSNIETPVGVDEVCNLEQALILILDKFSKARID